MRWVPRTLRYRVPMVMIVVFVAVLSVLMWVMSWIVEGSFDDVESARIVDDVATARTAFLSRGEWLGRTVADWARWTDTYDYTGGRYDEYPDDNLSTDVLTSLGVDFMAFCLPSGEIVGLFENGSDPGYLTPLPCEVGDSLQEEASLLRPEEPDDVWSGIVLLGERPARVVSCYITDNQQTAKPNGYLVIGSYVGEEDNAYVRNVTGFDVRIVCPSTRESAEEASAPVVVEYVDSSRITGTTTLVAANGAPAVDLTVVADRSDVQRALRTLSMIALGLLGATVLYAIVGDIALNRTILGRLAHLHWHVAGPHSTVETAVECVGGSDEITDLASALDRAEERARLTEWQLRHEARTDYLTGVLNRRGFMRDLERGISEAGRHDTKLALLTLDLDDFKSINDRAGHIAGDHILQWFANIISSTVREYSAVARTGGDEFAILLPHADVDDAGRVIERIHDLLENSECPCPAGQELNVSASIGVAFYPSDATDADGLISAADSAMYSAKGGSKSHE